MFPMRLIYLTTMARGNGSAERFNKCKLHITGIELLSSRIPQLKDCSKSGHVYRNKSLYAEQFARERRASVLEGR